MLFCDHISITFIDFPKVKLDKWVDQQTDRSTEQNEQIHVDTMLVSSMIYGAMMSFKKFIRGCQVKMLCGVGGVASPNYSWTEGVGFFLHFVHPRSMACKRNNATYDFTLLWL